MASMIGIRGGGPLVSTKGFREPSRVRLVWFMVEKG